MRANILIVVRQTTHKKSRYCLNISSRDSSTCTKDVEKRMSNPELDLVSCELEESKTNGVTDLRAYKGI